jgi:three-Cys-motif partner protein
MPSRNLHADPFDEATLTKLDIYKQYLTSWLPVFINTPGEIKIKIYDFFAGEGFDLNGIPGSPIIALRSIYEYRDQISKNRKKLRLLLNEFKPSKYNNLCSAVKAEITALTGIEDFLEIELKNEDFEKLFQAEKINVQFPNNLVFLDQNGIKHVNRDVFNVMANANKTDFLFFTSSSLLQRFEYDDYLPGFDGFISDRGFNDSHRNMVRCYKKFIPPGSDLKIYPFTLKKSSGHVYGLVFGSKSPYGVEKFLQVAWGKNSLNGEANFDIDGDTPDDQMSLPFESKKASKIDKFKANLYQFIISGRKLTNKDILEYTLDEGHIPSHASEAVKEMRDQGKLRHFSFPKIGCRQVYTNKEIVQFEVKDARKN